MQMTLGEEENVFFLLFDLCYWTETFDTYMKGSFGSEGAESNMHVSHKSCSGQQVLFSSQM